MQKSKKMGVIQLTTLTAINMMGSGIILLPANLASIGTISIFGWILAALGGYASGLCLFHLRHVQPQGRRYGRICGISLRYPWEFRS